MRYWLSMNVFVGVFGEPPMGNFLALSQVFVGGLPVVLLLQ